MLWYVQLQQTSGQDALQVHAGDSLAIISPTARLEAVPSEGCRPDDWHLATLHLLLDAGGQVTVDGELFRPRTLTHCSSNVILSAGHRCT